LIEIRKYVPEDYMTIQKRKFDALALLSFPEPMAMARSFLRGPSFTMVNGDIIACGGVLKLWKGVGEGWLLTSPLIEQHRMAFGRAAVKTINRLMDEMELERLQTMVDAEHWTSRGWLQWMGFKLEGRMAKYVGGRDFIRYAKVR
jgi:hypothetical protein